ncbi:hypothetical protein VTL71DRAFT_6328 [Oculimacula yallundae]|uniref:N-acetyltransferase domain-containing protein n=1 Tax=Oculimacula yallundae TaxID=86028 RepID=A0ABR4BWM9_9HELO
MEQPTQTPCTTAHAGTSTTNDISIRPLDLENGDFDAVYKLWTTTFPNWPIPRDLLERMLTHPFLSSNSRHFVSTTQTPSSQTPIITGFILSYLSDNAQTGFISALGITPSSRNQGIGSALLSKAKEALREAAKEKGVTLKKFVLGSVTPRFWPGVPVEFVGEGEGRGGFGRWWGGRGFTKSTGPIIKDLFKDIRTELMAPAIQEKILRTATEKGIRFAPWSEGGYEECMTKQQANFTWAKAYAVLAASSQHHEVMVAFDAETNEQLGWTLMCGPEAIVKDIYAFLPLAGELGLGSCEGGDVRGRRAEGKAEVGEAEGCRERKIGLIAAVGVDEKARGRGVGLALVGRAMANLKERGVEGIFIDSVIIRDFYERLGFETRWEYETWECPEQIEVEMEVKSMS